MKGSRRRFSREFKIEAVRQVVETERPVSQVASGLVLGRLGKVAKVALTGVRS